MSELSQLKSRIDALAQQAKATGGNLSSFSSKFSQSISEVSQIIGGSAQRKDQEMIASFEEAKGKVEAAVRALETAAKTGQAYGASL